MIKKIAQLSNQLRDEGLPVSIRSTYSATEVYMELGETDRDLLRTALRAIYVKDRYDIPKFNKIFEEIFKKEKEESDSDDLPDRSWSQGRSPSRPAAPHNPQSPAGRLRPRRTDRSPSRRGNAHR